MLVTHVYDDDRLVVSGVAFSGEPARLGWSRVRWSLTRSRMVTDNRCWLAGAGEDERR